MRALHQMVAVFLVLFLLVPTSLSQLAVASPAVASMRCTMYACGRLQISNVHWHPCAWELHMKGQLASAAPRHMHAGSEAASAVQPPEAAPGARGC